MRFIVVKMGEILKCPPALSVIQCLNDLGHSVVVCTIAEDNLQHYFGNIENVKFEFVGDSYNNKSNKVLKLARMFSIRKQLWEKIDAYYDDETVIWVISEVAVKHLGPKLLKRRYILHMLELLEGMYYISGNPILKLDHEAYAKNALALVEAEYNRAHITKAWWGLDKLPFVMPNKPYVAINIKRNAEITSSEKLRDLMKSLEGRKIILYQGNISKERPLDKFIKAVGELGNEYAFVMMLNGENPYPDLHTDNSYFVPFVPPPYHLEVTSRAFIGILSYVPIKNSYSILNTLYCAPNKIWEYSKFGVPMISNDLPALSYQYAVHKNGLCVDINDVESIKRGVLEIDRNYDEYSRNSLKFFESVDIKEIVSEIVKHSFS